MFLRTLVQKKGDRKYKYLQILESYREGRSVKQRTLLSFGNIDRWPKERLQKLIRLLQVMIGEEPGLSVGDVKVVSSVCYGPGLALGAVWRSIGMPQMIDVAIKDRHPEFDVPSVIEAMVLNRLVEPKSKLGVSRWIRRNYLCGLPLEKELPVQYLYRSLDYLTEAKEDLEEAIYRSVSDLFTLDVSLVFYDITSSYFEGNRCSLSKRGYSRDHRPDLYQIELGLVINPDGIPICHEVFEGNLKDVVTVPEVVKSLKERFNVVQVIFVGDSGMVGPDTTKALDDAGYQYILAQKLRRNSELYPVIFSMGEKQDWEKVLDNLYVKELESPFEKRRLIGCYNPVRAAQERSDRQVKLHRMDEYLKSFERPRRRGQTKDPVSIERQIRSFLERRCIGKFFEFSYRDEGDFSFSRRDDAIADEERLDGLRILETTSQLPAADVAKSYRMLSEVEDSFREMKSFVRIRPIRHFNDLRVKGHVTVCVLAYLMERLMERMLGAAGLDMTAQSALEELKGIDLVTLELDGARLRKSVEPNKLQTQILEALVVKKIPKLMPAD